MLVRQTLVTSGYGVDFITNATGSQFKAGFAAFVEKRKAAGKGATTIVYFAGHGVQVEGMNFLLPVDADMTTPSDVRRDAHNVGEMVQALGTTGGGSVTLFILDACSNNPFASDLEIGKSRGLARGDVIRTVEKSKISKPREYEVDDLLIALAAEPGTVALDGEGENGPYVRALVKAIQQPKTDIRIALARAREEVQHLTNGVQTSYFYSVQGALRRSLKILDITKQR